MTMVNVDKALALAILESLGIHPENVARLRVTWPATMNAPKIDVRYIPRRQGA